MENREQPFIDYLSKFREDDNRAALAALRRGLGQPPGTVYEMYPYVVPWLPKDASRWREDAYFTIASLFAFHPLGGGSGNMGDHFAVAGGKDENQEKATERRFTVLLAAHRDDLADHLRQAVSLLRAKEVPVNWHRLFADIQNWDHSAGFVQRNWARSFWGYRKPETEEQ